MTLSVRETAIPGVLLVEPRVHGDARGFFQELFHEEKYREAGIEAHFVQDNWSRSGKGVLRGLHYQLEYPQAKLVCAVRGEILDVAVDIRRGSPTFGKWTAARLSEENHRQIFIPHGFAHGFAVLSESADVLYKCDEFYRPEDDYGILWNDPAIGIEWPVEGALVSEKDRGHRRLGEVDEALLPVFAG